MSRPCSVGLDESCLVVWLNRHQHLGERVRFVAPMTGELARCIEALGST